jgi:hypothetical protein
MQHTEKKQELKEKQKQDNFVHLTLNLERIKLELAGNDAEKCLREVNKILDKVLHITSHLDEFIFGNDMQQDMLSEELMSNSTVNKLMNTFSEIYDDYRTSRVAIENKKVVELEKGKVEHQLDFKEVQKNVSRLLLPIQKEEVKHAIIHVKGAIKSDETKKITDMIAQELQQAELHTICTKSDVPSHTIVEGIFFGEFEPEDYDEDE